MPTSKKVTKKPIIQQVQHMKPMGPKLLLIKCKTTFQLPNNQKKSYFFSNLLFFPNSFFNVFFLQDVFFNEFKRKTRNSFVRFLLLHKSCQLGQIFFFVLAVLIWIITPFLFTGTQIIRYHLLNSTISLITIFFFV